jgi:hypothetical protein
MYQDNLENVFYSDNNNDFLITNKNYHLEAIKYAMYKDYKDNLPFYYINNDIKFLLYPLNLDKLIFLCVRENNTFFYLKYKPIKTLRYEKKKADILIHTNYLGKLFIIQIDREYYYDKKLKTIPIGWHGSINPPTDMDGRILIDLKEEI